MLLLVTDVILIGLFLKMKCRLQSSLEKLNVTYFLGNSIFSTNIEIRELHAKPQKKLIEHKVVLTFFVVIEEIIKRRDVVLFYRIKLFLFGFLFV